MTYEAKNELIRVSERSGERKDRFSSLSYNIYVSNEVERKMARNPRNNMDRLNRMLQFKAPDVS